MINRELRQRGWLYVTILCAFSLLALVWFKFQPSVDAHSGPRCGGAVCLALLEDNAG